MWECSLLARVVADQSAPHRARVLRRSVQQSRVPATRCHRRAGVPRRRAAIQPRSVRRADLRGRADVGLPLLTRDADDSRIGRRQGDLVIGARFAAATHGRYLVEPPPSSGARAAARRLSWLRGGGRRAARAPARDSRRRAWLLVSIQGLHRFYQRRSQDVVASWMTRQDRELAIADNSRTCHAVIDAVAREYAGAAARSCSPAFRRAWRWRFARRRRRRGRSPASIAGGGDVPPELDAAALRPRSPRRWSAAACATSWYTAEKVSTRSCGGCARPASASRRSSSTAATSGPTTFIDAAGAFLRERRPMIDIRPATVADAAAAGRAALGISLAAPDADEPHDAFIERCTAWMRRELGRHDVAVPGSRSTERAHRRPGLAQHDPEDSESGRRARAPRVLSNCTSSRPRAAESARELLEAALAWRGRTRVDRVVLWPSTEA